MRWLLRRGIRPWAALTLVGAAGGAALSLPSNSSTNSGDITMLTGVVRFARTGLVVTSIVWDYHRTLYGKNKSVTKEDPEYPNVVSAVHRRSAEKLLSLCCANGGVFIKVGQHIGAWDYLVPPEYVQILSVLHSKAPPHRMKDVMQVLKEDLKCDPLDVFAEIDPKPLGTASLAQVHRAVLPNGNEVAVKVQHPLVKRYSEVDMHMMETLVNIVSRIFPDFKFQWLVDETKRNLPKELDFMQEGENAEKLRKVFGHIPWLRIPEIYWDMTTSRVLTMEFCPGGQVNDLSFLRNNGINPQDVSNRLGQLYAEMIFKEGLVHCDPHPGNILIHCQPGNKLEVTLLDHGLYLEMSPSFKSSYARMWLAILSADVEGMRVAARELNVERFYGIVAVMLAARPWATIVSGIHKKSEEKGEQAVLQTNVSQYLPEISIVLDTVPREMLLAFKTNDLLRGIDSSLGVSRSQSSLLSMSRSCIKVVYGERAKQCESVAKMLWTRMQEQWQLFRLTLLQFTLWIGAAWKSSNNNLTIR